MPDIALNLGLSLLVFKVLNEAEDWNRSIRFTDTQGNPAKGNKMTLDPEAKGSLRTHPRGSPGRVGFGETN